MIEVEELPIVDGANAIRELPFVTETPEGNPLFWSVENCGHQDTDVERGAFFATLAIDVARKYDVPELIGFVIGDMIRAGKYSPLEVGFLSVVASAARAGSMN
jgi:hypothetical protein